MRQQIPRPTGWVVWLLAAVALVSFLPACASTHWRSRNTQKVSFISVPSGAQVSIDGEQRGLTPVDVELTKKTVRVRMEKDDYRPIDVFIAPKQPSLARYLLLVILQLDALLFYNHAMLHREFDGQYKYLLEPAARSEVDSK